MESIGDKRDIEHKARDHPTRMKRSSYSTRSYQNLVSTNIVLNPGFVAHVGSLGLGAGGARAFDPKHIDAWSGKSSRSSCQRSRLNDGNRRSHGWFLVRGSPELDSLRLSGAKENSTHGNDAVDDRFPSTDARPALEYLAGVSSLQRESRYFNSDK